MRPYDLATLFGTSDSEGNQVLRSGQHLNEKTLMRGRAGPWLSLDIAPAFYRASGRGGQPDVSGSNPLLKKARFPTGPPQPRQTLLTIYRISAEHTRRITNEKKLTRMEEEGQAALEMAQEEDAPTEACPEDAQAVELITGGMG